MSTLIINGNTNPETFANAIVAAQSKSLKIFCERLSDIYILHTADSYTILSQRDDWQNHVATYHVSQNNLIHRVIDLTNGLESITGFAEYIESIVKGLNNSNNIIVDLTNGTTLYKTLLSTTAYLLDLKHLYAIDSIKLFKNIQKPGFLTDETLETFYTPSPPSTQLDRIAYLNLVEVIRYKSIIDGHTNKYLSIDTLSSDEEFFRNNLINSIQLKLSGDRLDKADNSIYRIASSSISASLEDLIRVILDKLSGNADAPSASHKLTFGQKTNMLKATIEKNLPLHFDFEFYRMFNDFMVYLRNSSTHKGKLLTDVERFKAELSVKMALPFIQFYTDIVYPSFAIGAEVKVPSKITQLSIANIKSDDVFYFGLDGDGTGSELEKFFLNSSDEVNFRKFSQSILAAVGKISAFIKSRQPKGSVIFAAGDDLLFQGQFTEDDLKEMQNIYKDSTLGLTCSIGYGKSLREVYVAMKLAKSEPGKNAIFGARIE